MEGGEARGGLPQAWPAGLGAGGAGGVVAVAF